MRYPLPVCVFIAHVERGNRKIGDCQQNKWVSGLESAFAVGYLLASLWEGVINISWQGPCVRNIGIIDTNSPLDAPFPV